jgi:hypothetical protein
MQYAFRRSLSSIHFDGPSGSRTTSKHHSTRHNYYSGSRRVANSAQCKVEDVDTTNFKPRRASMNDLSSYAESQRVPEVSPSSTILKKDGAIIQGILRAPSEFYVFLFALFLQVNELESPPHGRRSKLTYSDKYITKRTITYCRGAPLPMPVLR